MLELHKAILIGYNCPLCSKKVEEGHTCRFDCNKCSRCFASKVLLNSHLKIHDRLELVSYSVSKLVHHEDLNMQLCNLNFN